MAKVVVGGSRICNVSAISFENGRLHLDTSVLDLESDVRFEMHDGSTSSLFCDKLILTNHSCVSLISDNDGELASNLYLVSDSDDAEKLEEPILIKSVGEGVTTVEVYGGLNSLEANGCEVFFDNYVVYMANVSDEVLVADTGIRGIFSMNESGKELGFKKITQDSVINNTRKPLIRGCGFEKVLNKDYTGYEYEDARIPEYATSGSAAADFFCAEKVQIPPAKIVDGKLVVKPTLVHTGIKAFMEDNEVLHLYNRSSGPKRGLVLANSVGVVDSDYYSNEGNDGEIMFAFYNFSGEPLTIEVGDRIGQGEFSILSKPEDAIVKDDKRSGGFGSTGTR